MTASLEGVGALCPWGPVQEKATQQGSCGFSVRLLGGCLALNFGLADLFIDVPSVCHLIWQLSEFPILVSGEI